MSKEDKIVFCTGGGCTAKLGAGVLSRILEKLPRAKKTRIFWLATTAGMMPQSTALRTTLRWCRPWTFSRRWWTTPTPLGKLQPRTP